MTSHALRFLVVVVKIVPSVKRSRESVKNQQKRHVGQGKLPRCFTKLCARLLYKFKEIQRGDVCFFFLINEELRSVVNEHFNGKLFSQILDTECAAGKRVLTNTISLMRKRIEGEKGVSEIGDIEQLEQFLNNSQMEIEAIRILYLA